MTETRKLQSSNLAEASWRDETLTVTFQSGKSYEYAGVPRAMFQALCDASSCGRYLSQHIKGAFPFKEV
jgi:hypothetical protein